MTLRLSSAGESHGPALVAIVSGLPAGLILDRQAIDGDLKRRQEGYGRSPRQQIEQDRIDVLAGLRRGRDVFGSRARPVSCTMIERTNACGVRHSSGEPERRGYDDQQAKKPGSAARPMWMVHGITSEATDRTTRS